MTQLEKPQANLMYFMRRTVKKQRGNHETQANKA